MSQGLRGVRKQQDRLAPCIPSKSRRRQRARTDLCGGRRVIGVPTATFVRRVRGGASLNSYASSVACAG